MTKPPAELRKILARLKEFRVVLYGSRGIAEKLGTVPPPEADWDYCIFTDDPYELQAVRIALFQLAVEHWLCWIGRPNGYVTVSGLNMDLSVHPTVKEEEFRLYDALRARGVPKAVAATALNCMESHRLDKQMLKPMQEGRWGK